VKSLSLIFTGLLLSCAFAADKSRPDTLKHWQSFFDRKAYSASVRDSVRIPSATLFSGPAGAIRVALSSPSCVCLSRDDEYVFYSPDTGVFRVYFSTYSTGALYADTVTVRITDFPPVLKLGNRNPVADIGKPIPMDLDISDDGDSFCVYADLDGDGRTDTSCCGVKNPLFRYTRPTRTGEKEKIMQCRITVADNDSHRVSDTAILTVLYKPPRARAGSNIIACPDEPVVFSGKASRDVNGAITRYIWDFNADGKADTVLYAPEVERSFSTPGDFSVILRVMDEDKNISLPDTVFLSVYRDKPTASATAPHEARRGEEISFVGTGNVNCGVIEKYLWDFYGTGKWDFASRSCGRVSHIYKDAGTFQARFMVLDSQGDSAVLLWPVKVSP
jgi:PKD repeat protein